MKVKPFLIGAALLFLHPHLFSQSFFYVSSGSNLFIGSGQTVSMDSLVFVPSAGYNITGLTSVAHNTTITNPSSNPYISRVYLFNGTLPAFSGSVSVYYQTSELNSLTPATLQVNAFGTTAWTSYVSTTGANFATASGLSAVTLTEITLASAALPLPLKWLSVNAFDNNGMNEVTWTTADEANCKNFQVYKSTDGSSWSAAGFPVAARNTEGPNDYSWNDSSITSGISYYRVRQSDYDNNYSYSSIVTVKSSGIFSVVIYPNPASSALSVAINNSSLHFKQLRIYDGSGRLVRQETGGEDSHYLFNISGLASGAYQLMINLSDGTVSTKSFFKQ